MLPPTDLSAIARNHPDECHDGGEVERRAILCLPALAAAGVMLPQARVQPGRLDFADLLAKLTPLAKKLVADKNPNEESYLHQVAALLTLGTEVPNPKLRPFRTLKGVSTGSIHRELPLSVLRFRVAPNGMIPLHNHNGYNGIMLGLSGEFRVRSFDPLGADPLPDRGPVMLRETVDQLVTPGRIATLTRKRDNLHLVQAGPAGGVALDIFTMFEDRGPSGFFDLAKKPSDRNKRIYEAKPR